MTGITSAEGVPSEIRKATASAASGSVAAIRRLRPKNAAEDMGRPAIAKRSSVCALMPAGRMEMRARASASRRGVTMRSPNEPSVLQGARSP